MSVRLGLRVGLRSWNANQVFYRPLAKTKPNKKCTNMTGSWSACSYTVGPTTLTKIHGEKLVYCWGVGPTCNLHCIILNRLAYCASYSETILIYLVECNLENVRLFFVFVFPKSLYTLHDFSISWAFWASWAFHSRPTTKSEAHCLCLLLVCLQVWYKFVIHYYVSSKISLVKSTELYTNNFFP